MTESGHRGPGQRVALLVLGSRGDVQPFVALGTELVSRGHEVTVAAPEDLRWLLERAGLDFQSLPMSPDAVFRLPSVAAAVRRGPSLVRMARALPTPPEEQRAALQAAVWRAGEGADLVVNALYTRQAAVAGQGPPWATTSTWPITPTSAFPALGAPRLPLGGGYNRLSHLLRGELEWYYVRPSVNAYRSRLGSRPLGRRSPFRGLGRERPLLYPFSPAVVPPPCDWPSNCHVTGYWWWDQEWEPPADLVRFLADGEPPVVATFGSTWPVHDQDRSLRLLIGAARQAGRRLVVVDGPAAGLPEGVLRVSDVEYRWLFPRAAAVVHHGGCGTTAEVLRAGVPQVVVPTLADNPFWAGRMAELGVAPRPVPFARLDGRGLVRALSRAVGDPRLRERAGQLAVHIGAERGVERAADILERWLTTSRTRGRPTGREPVTQAGRGPAHGSSSIRNDRS